MGELADVARAAARAYRLGMNGRASTLFVRWIDGIGAQLAACPTRAAALAPALAAALAAQERGDPIGLADQLEFELAPALDSADSA